jgi:methylated-DNA-[protein]-cysteine S-methyltransferase
MPFLLFPTIFGACGVAWNEQGATAFQLPEASEAETAERLSARSDAVPANWESAPAWVRVLIGRVQQHLAGHPQNFDDTPIDWSAVSEFQRAVYRETLAVGSGSKRSYGEIARALALGPEAARAVGVALATNPWPLIVPCHRVVSSSGKMTGFSGPGGIRTKTRLLVIEGAELLSE